MAALEPFGRDCRRSRMGVMATRPSSPLSVTATPMTYPDVMTLERTSEKHGSPGVGRSDWMQSMDRIPLLTDRELEVFRLLAEGPTNTEIAETLFITERTVRAHTASILLKLGLESRLKASMAAFAFTRNIMACRCGSVRAA